MITFARSRLVQAGAAVAATLLVAGTAAPLHASDVPAAGATTQAKQTADSERRVCVRMEMPNTRLPRRVCKTAAEWEREGGVPSSN